MSEVTASREASASAEQAKAEIMNCDKEIGSIRSQLRALGSASGEGSEPSNKLTIAWNKTDGLPEAAKPSASLQLSSPVEEKELTTPSEEIVFEGVDLSMATLTVSAKDAEIPLGSSTAYDLSKVFSETTVASSCELPVAILPPDSSEDQVVEPVCTMAFLLSFEPAAKEKRDKLYEELNELTRRKARAVEQLRQVALAASRNPSESSSSQVARKSPAVSSGFLNRKQEEAKTGKIMEFYNKHLGPNSLIRRTFPIAKNYLIFFGVVGFFHFQGQQFALPPPV